MAAVPCLVITGGGGIIRLYRLSFVFVHAAVTDLDGILVEDFSELVIFRKVLVY